VLWRMVLTLAAAPPVCGASGSLGHRPNVPEARGMIIVSAMTQEDRM